MRLNFELLAESPDTRARAGRLRTAHNEVLTPLFMPVATVGAMRAQSLEALEEAGSQILLANTYHLFLRPGAEVFRKMGGLHGFSTWPRSFLTDSGGFQIFSLSDRNKVSEEGVQFQSFVDGATHNFTPEASIGMQRALNSDIMMALDVCVPSTSNRTITEEALERTSRWARRSLAARGDSAQSMFAIVQGACYTDLRKRSAEALCELPFDGFAIGGLAVGESKSEREDVTEFTAPLLPSYLPRYLMGVGTPSDLLEAVHRGVDMFDCILPNALAQFGVAFTFQGKVKFARGVYRGVNEPIEKDCPCPVCRRYSRGYLHHLTKCEETSGWQLISTHNIYFYHRLMQRLRSSIFEGRFAQVYKELRPLLGADDVENPINVPRPPKVYPKPSEELGDYSLHRSPQGFVSVRQKSSGEVMHPGGPPTAEAEQLYLGPSRLVERALEPGERPLVVWDVGLGAAINAMSALRAVENELKKTPTDGPAPRGLQIVSFERDLDPLRLAISHRNHFSHLLHEAPRDLLKHSRWAQKKGRIQWELLEGDFRDRLGDAPAPDLVFFDPFSLHTDSELWTEEVFAKIFARRAPEGCALFTYSVSTAVRGALLKAGFKVARGAPTGPKTETTVGLSPEAISLYPNLALIEGTRLAPLRKSVPETIEKIQ